MSSERKVELIVCGAAGRMGKRIIALAYQDPRFTVVGATEAASSPVLGQDAGTVAGTEALGVEIGQDLASAGEPGAVCLDFTSAEASLENMRTAADKGLAIVVGSSGMDAGQRAEAESLATTMPTLIAANVSRGVAVLSELVGSAVGMLGKDFDCEIVELHHNQKKDSPSGTALALAERAAEASGANPAKDLVTARQGTVGARPSGEIGVVALRGGDSAGEHTVMLVGNGERIELVHRATSRDCLALGALSAAAWLAGKPAGLYSMRDVLAGD
ncbi:MAG: 4-hydroxy-tetrahydrodipicolinate reductase [Deltaproteobacteria bacterium]